MTPQKESHFQHTIPATTRKCKQIVNTNRRACGFLLERFLFSIWLPFNDFQKLWHRSCPSVFCLRFPAISCHFLSLILKCVKPYKQQLMREKVHYTPTGSDEQEKKSSVQLSNNIKADGSWGERRAKGMIHSHSHWLIKPTMSTLWKHCALVRYYQPMFFLARVCHIPPW